jgi:glycosyltransferase involved in cell wall biosynthesis
MVIMPRATILTAVFNCEDYIALAVESALAQTERDIEVLVIDDGSTDRTAEILASYDDPRLGILRRERGGQARALNIGLASCRSAYVAILDADDVVLPDRVRLQADFLDANAEIVLVGSRFRPSIDAKGDPIGRAVLPMNVENMIADLQKFITPMFHSSVMYRKSAVLAVGGYDESLVCNKDTDLYTRLIGPSRRRNIANLDAELSLKRLHPGQYFGPENGVRTSPEGLRSAETVRRRIAEAFGPPLPQEALRLEERPPLPRAVDSR